MVEFPIGQIAPKEGEGDSREDFVETTYVCNPGLSLRLKCAITGL